MVCDAFNMDKTHSYYNSVVLSCFKSLFQVKGNVPCLVLTVRSGMAGYHKTLIKHLEMFIITYCGTVNTVNVNECMNVCVWCPVTYLHSIQGVNLPRSHCSQDRL